MREVSAPSLVASCGLRVQAWLLVATMVLLPSTMLHCGRSSFVDALQFSRPSLFKRQVSTKRRFRRHSDYEDETLLSPAGKAASGYFSRRPWISSPAKIPVNDIDQLHRAVLDYRQPLKNLEIQALAQSQVHDCLTSTENHQVLQLFKERFESNSVPGNRTDDAVLAIALEGGGMRGCVSAGMAAAIASLGLTHAIDKIYGSSAGSVIGAYMVSRQMCVDVYLDLLPAAKKRFVCKKRLVKSMVGSLVDLLVRGGKKGGASRSSGEASMTLDTFNEANMSPGMNISYVLDGILDAQHGIRPLDFEKFQTNNQRQELRVVSSTVDEKGNMYSKVFGNRDFFGPNRSQKVNGTPREGLFACLQASMTVPGATGPPVDLRNGTCGEVLSCFDAFCFEPLPYRSAVDEGATHVLVLCSRPADYLPKTQQGVYEQGVAPLYFHSHGQPKVAKFFEQGGQQYVYAEDLMLLEQAKFSSTPVKVPPPRILYGVDPTTESQRDIHYRDEVWKQAHLLPLKVPEGTPELPTLSQDKRAVLEAVRGGFSAAYDLLAPIVGLDPQETLTGEQAARLLFPDEPVPAPCTKTLLQTQLQVPGEAIENIPTEIRVFSSRTAMAMKQGRLEFGLHCHSELSHTLLHALPGFQDGRFGHLAKDLRSRSLLRQGERPAAL